MALSLPDPELVQASSIEPTSTAGVGAATDIANASNQHATAQLGEDALVLHRGSTPRAQGETDLTQHPVTPATSSSASPLTLQTASAQPVVENTVIQGIHFSNEQANSIAQHIAAEKLAWLSKIKDHVSDRIDTAIFSAEAHFASAIHQLQQIPAKRQDMIRLYGGASFDPNPPGIKYPDELAQDLQKASKDICSGLSSLGEMMTEKKHPSYNISRALVHRALQSTGTAGPAAFEAELHQLYIEEHSASDRLTPLTTQINDEDWAVVSKPPIRLPFPAEQNTTQAAGNIKVEVEGPRSAKSKTASSTTPSAKPTPKKKADSNMKQTWRDNPKNGVIVYLEASEQDIVRTLQSFWGRQMWESEGYILPPGTIFYAGMSEGPEKNFYKEKSAKYCSTSHGTGWLVIVPYDVRNCNECQHSKKFLSVNAYLPPGNRYYILRRGWSINSEGDVLDTKKNLASPINNISRLTLMGRTVWQSESEFTRTDIGIPQHIDKAYREGALSKLSLANVDRWLNLNDKGKPKYKVTFDRGSRKWDIGSARRVIPMQSSDKNDKKSLVTFHAERMREVWDFTGFGDEELEKVLGKMLDTVDDLQCAEKIPESFDTRTHWFTREDAEEFRNRGSLERLITHLGGSVPKSRKVESQDQKAAKKRVTTGIAKQSEASQKRKAATETFEQNEKKIKLEKDEEDDGAGGEEKDTSPVPCSFEDFLARES
ncbi:hypothetical protein HBH56_178850 [Parastagonospora nodorum]|uniref:Uncharacterized protein n=2 Tax=Phaeosphaeria nodorum (strain SN15 / ATCC MYA-4574 / FGSC 10173) TaxID=321614 RepID=Q0U0N9_PHANO|nr:hypothetical protein SNOG_14751 [Parastagonospora nodorum SN15]KAH3908190.1 hypothetical protein HBH56_178850 [Parastagonospora nodorum]EAT77943.2 hypothetical protein SNOG_14751 [Parastagonospora nodorum SN15]KAH3932039.1 hypothetical protein HBH54_090970 [Parastagonospora nodorum]KAH3939263.1 hypothetical protein HBH53_237400 [Parastagonospora nodorum]KAH3956793.1 hypothetical protein HBH51_234520 [Parastagonospora nodorum]